jgi:ABC-type multidrug transport system permease subunit
MLDRLFLLRSGEIIYDGNAADAVAYLADVGYSYDGVSNPADHIMEVISPKMGETKAALEARCLVRQAYVTPDVDLEANMDTPLPVPEVPPSRRLQFWILFRRQALNEAREWRMHILNFLVTSLSGIMIGAVWFHIGFAQNSVARRTSCIYFAAVNQSLFSAMKAILAFPDQRAVMMRERRAKMYSCLPGFLSWSFIDMLFNIPWACLFAVITYFMVGLQNDAGKFFVWMLILCLDKMCAGSLATTICAITREASTAVVVLPVWLEMNRLFSGYFLPPNLLPTHYVWLDPLSYVKYVYVAVTLNELDGLVLPCPNVTGTNVTSTCNPHLAHATIKKFGLDFITPAGCIGALFAYIIFCRTTAYFFLRFLKH